MEQPQYEPGSYLLFKDLETEQHYRLQRLRHHHRFLHDWGVVCGLWVVPINDPGRAWVVQVCPGYAISCCGDEIEVSAPAPVDVRDYLWREPRDRIKRLPRIAYVGIRYAEQQARPVPANPPRCGCEDPIYEPSRIQDGFQVDILWDLPAAGRTESFDLCKQQSAPLPDCPDSPYVFLASLTLPASEGDPIIAGHIENWVCRRRA
jgi:hypothetical protein